MGELGLRVGRKLRYGMVGGGPDAFIGAVHRRAAELDGDAQLVAGVFSSDAAKSRHQGRLLLLDPARVYDTYQQMVEREANRDDDEQLDFVVIVTPNHLHVPIAKVFVSQGFAVVCDKPLATKLADADDLAAMVSKHEVVFGVTYNYSGYPMVKQAREMVRAGDIGSVRRVVVEYAQGWLSTALETTGQKQAAWRADPNQTGPALALGDIGSHAEHLTRYVTGLSLESLCADLSTFVEGRVLEDDANILLHLTGGVRGVLSASQISVGEENNLSLRVYGTTGALIWRQEEPNVLAHMPDGKARRVLMRGNDYLCEAAKKCSRLPPGHPEGYLEAFANVYANVLRTVDHKLAGTNPSEYDLDFPTVHDGAAGVRFIERAVQSNHERRWIDF